MRHSRVGRLTARAGRVVAVCAFSLGAPALAFAQEASPRMGRIEVVLDASGSMRGRLGAVEKMAVARALIAALREDLAESGATPSMGLRVFGGGSDRSERNCRDTERLLVPPDSSASWDRVLAGIAPRGVSPLTEALEKAIADTANTYILVTDGTDNCGRDACAAWRGQGRVATGRARLHIVALDPSPGDIEPLRCLSRAGSGAFIQLKDANDVGTVANRLALILRNEGQLNVRTSIGADSMFTVPIEVRQPLTRELVARMTSNAAASVPAGMYTIVAGTTPPVSLERVLVLPGETTTVDQTGFGRLRVDLLDRDNVPKRVPMSIFRTGDIDELRFARTGDPVVLAAGVYDIRLDLGDTFDFRYGVRVEPGRTKRVVVGGTGSLRLVAPGIDGSTTGARISGRGRVDSIAVGSPVQLPAGSYRVTVRSIPPYVADNQVVEPERETRVEISRAGLLGVDVIGFGGITPDVEIDVFAPATGEPYGTLRSGERRLAMPGTYRLELQTVPKRVVDAVVVRSGRATVIERPGLSRLELGPELLATDVDYRIEVLDAAGETLGTASGRAPVVHVWPARYRVRVWRADALVFDGPITVAADRAARIDSNFPARGDEP